VDVAVTGMTETGDRKSYFFWSCAAKRTGLQAVLAARRYPDSVFEAGISQSIGKLAANFPNFFTRLAAEAAFERNGLVPTNDLLDLAQLGSHGTFLSIQLDDEVRLTTLESRTARTVIGRGKRKGVRQFRCTRKETSAKMSCNALTASPMEPKPTANDERTAATESA